jgi:hypothetical protein
MNSFPSNIVSINHPSIHPSIDHILYQIDPRLFQVFSLKTYQMLLVKGKRGGYKLFALFNYFSLLHRLLQQSSTRIEIYTLRHPLNTFFLS